MNKIDILIPTLNSRKDQFSYIYNKITKQIINNNLCESINIRYYLDNKQASVGFKRNSLINRSYAEYVCFVDDDDDVSDDYINLIYEAANSELDCASLTGIMTTNKLNPKKFVHSIEYDQYFEKDNIYYRPPNHLNLIKREIASKFKFPEKNFGEDTGWAMQICKSGIIKTEYKINKPLYHYNFNTYTTETHFKG